MKNAELVKIEIVDNNGIVFDTFKTLDDYDDYMMDAMVDLDDSGLSAGFKVWYWVVKNNKLLKMNYNQFMEMI